MKETKYLSMATLHVSYACVAVEKPKAVEDFFARHTEMYATSSSICRVNAVLYAVSILQIEKACIAWRSAVVAKSCAFTPRSNRRPQRMQATSETALDIRLTLVVCSFSFVLVFLVGTASVPNFYFFQLFLSFFILWAPEIWSHKCGIVKNPAANENINFRNNLFQIAITTAK